MRKSSGGHDRRLTPAAAGAMYLRLSEGASAAQSVEELPSTRFRVIAAALAVMVVIGGLAIPRAALASATRTHHPSHFMGLVLARRADDNGGGDDHHGDAGGGGDHHGDEGVMPSANSGNMARSANTRASRHSTNGARSANSRASRHSTNGARSANTRASRHHSANTQASRHQSANTRASQNTAAGMDHSMQQSANDSE